MINFRNLQNIFFYKNQTRGQWRITKMRKIGPRHGRKNYKTTKMLQNSPFGFGPTSPQHMQTPTFCDHATGLTVWLFRRMVNQTTEVAAFSCSVQAEKGFFLF